MTIEEGLRSDDPEIVRIYADLALSQTPWSINTITDMMKTRFYIYADNGDYYLMDRKDRVVMRHKGIKLNFTFKSKELCQ